MSKSWQEVKSVLDDPYVSADTKEQLLAAYVWENGDDASAEAEDYTDGTKASYDIDGADALGNQYGINTDMVYQEAKKESDESGYSGRLAAQGVETGRTDIEGMQAPTEGSTTGVQKSNEIFDAARPALKIFQDFLPINDKVPGDTLGRYGKIKIEDINTRYDEQMGISFKNFLDDAARLRAAYTTLNDLNTTSEGELNKTYKEWTGPAANASYQYWSEKMAPNIKDLLEYLETSPDMIDTAVTNIFTACKDKANDVIALFQGLHGTMGSATPEIANKVVDLANGNLGDDDQDKILEVAAWVDASTGSNLESTIRSDDCDLNSENKDYVVRECKKWIRDSFNQDLHENLYVNFKQACDDALEAVNSHYETLNGYLKDYENKFGAAPPPGATNPPPGTQNPPPGSQNPPPGSSNPPPVNTPPPSSSGPPPGSYTPPPVDAPLPGDDTSPSGTDPGGGKPGGDKPDGVPDPNNPNDPDNSDGVPDPANPNDPDNPGNQDPNAPTSPTTGDQEETVSIKDGDREISVTSPDGQGMVKVTVDDGSGQPKTYTLDFGGADPTNPSTLPGQPGVPGSSGTPGTTGQPDAQGDFGPNGQPPTVPGMDAPIEPGPDGKCTITDGDLTITAERPEGQPDTVVVTVDDGTGDPTTYNLDYSDATTDQGAGPDGLVAPLDPGDTRPGAVAGELPPELVDANRQVDQADFTPSPDQGGTQPAYGEMPATLAEDPQVSTQPAFGEMPAQDPQVGTQPAYGDQQAPLQSDPAQHHFATAAAAANDPTMSGFNGSHGDLGDQAGSFGGPHQQSSPYMHGSGGEASLPSAPDNPGDQSGQGQAHPGMAGGMPMMGGAPGGGGGGDSERAGSQWRTTGDLFDEPVDPQLRRSFGGEG